MFALLAELLKSMFPILGYLKSATFPQPLSKEDEAMYLELWSQGDREARNKLIEHNLRLVAHIAKKYDSKKTSNEDFISIGTFGLIKAVDTFSFDKKHRLTTYAARCIENEILMHLRTIKKTLHDISLNDPIGVDKDGNEIALIDVIGIENEVDITGDMLKRENLGKLELFLDALDEKEKEILTLRYGLYGCEEKTQRQIAKEKKISRSYVSRIEKRAFMKLMRAFMNEENKSKK